MIKISMVLVSMLPAAAALTFSARAQEASENAVKIEVDPASKARIEFLEKYWNFGSIPESTTVSHDFPFRNNGTDTLVITRVKPTCGCTVAPLSADHVAPGDTAVMSISLNTRRLHGKVRKFVNVDCNDPINPYYKLSFDAIVDNPDRLIVTSPQIADFGNFKELREATAQLKIANSSANPVTLTVVYKPPRDLLGVSFGKSNLAPGDSTTMTIRLQNEIDPGRFSSTITIEPRDHPDWRISVPVQGNSVK